MTARVTVRPAVLDDSRAIAVGVRALLRELSGNSTREVERFEETYASLLAPESAGGVLVAVGLAGVVGLLTYSVHVALRVGGDYALIEELWVEPAVRGRGVGLLLLDAVRAEGARLQCRRLEVGLPSSTFVGLADTRDFYLNAGFRALGERLVIDQLSRYEG